MKALLYILLLLAPVCTRAQVIITYAGTGAVGYTGDGGPATNAQFQELVGIATDTAGNLYVPDYNNNVIRKVDTGGIIITIAGTGIAGYSGDGGPASAAQFNHPWNIAVDLVGNLYIAEQVNNTIRKISTSGIITTFAGNGSSGFGGDGGPATAAAFNDPWGIACADNGDVYISDINNHRIRKVNPFGTIISIAGTGTPGYNGDNISATTAELSSPTGLAWVGGNLYIADKLNNRIRMISSGQISTIAGTGVQGNTGDNGPATAAKINSPLGLTQDAEGNLLFSDFGNNVVRKIKGPIISRVAGTGIYGSAGDGGNALAAQFAQPWGVASGKNGSILVADKNNYKVRKIYTPPASGVAAVAAGVVSIYPNPTTQSLTINASGMVSRVEVFSISGRQVYMQDCNSKVVTIDVSVLPAGTYLLRINGTETRQFTRL